ncbi:uncharacterized protein TNCV_3914031 [Trichonephila clavipes]|nr:uncharacterized protein TNCV_3914031 [Trichonephila clavipes]
MKEIKREQHNPQVQSCSVTPQKGLHLKSIMLGNEIVSALIDTGSTGLGQPEVITKCSFEYDFVLDKDQYSLTWHVVPTKQLNFEAIIGTDILGQSSLNFTQEGVMFHKHEEEVCLMQLSGVHPEDELDFSHILDSQKTSGSLCDTMALKAWYWLKRALVPVPHVRVPTAAFFTNVKATIYAEQLTPLDAAAFGCSDISELRLSLPEAEQSHDSVTFKHLSNRVYHPRTVLPKA